MSLAFINMVTACSLQQRIRRMNDYKFLLTYGIWEKGGHNLNMLCRLVITFSPHTHDRKWVFRREWVTSNLEHENGIFKDQQS